MHSPWYGSTRALILVLCYHVRVLRSTDNAVKNHFHATMKAKTGNQRSRMLVRVGAVSP